jgi:hypothetical protein
MFIRGNIYGSESNRHDDSFYRGIVVKNNDPLKLNRVKIYIPEVSNQPYDEWFEEYDEFKIKAAGKNNVDDSWSDTKIYEEIAALIPWAEPCFPILGESGNSRYYKEGEISSISDTNYTYALSAIDEDPPTLENGSFAPAILYENIDTVVGDAFSSPIAAFTPRCNTYAFSYRPSKFVNKTKGVINIPQVGSKVWVFHYQGDLNFPVYFGSTQDFRSLTLMNDTDNKTKLSPSYPLDFEN